MFKIEDELKKVDQKLMELEQKNISGRIDVFVYEERKNTLLATKQLLLATKSEGYKTV